jgi:ABC-2 type transport system ATP-binding protein
MPNNDPAAPRALVPALDVTGLTKEYGGRRVLDSLDLTLPPQALVGLLGPNGAGKTTLIKLVSGLISPDGGRIRIAGHDLQAQEAQARGALAYVPDVPHFYTELTVLEHLELLARAHNALDGFPARAEKLLRRFGLWDARDAPPFTLSRGMTQKLALCCGFIRPSQVLLMDEPGGTLDIRSVDTLYALLTEYRQGGGLAVLSSHQWEALQSLCDIFVLMDAGQILAAGHLPFLRDAAELPADAGLREVYLTLLEEPSLPDLAGVAEPQA